MSRCPLYYLGESQEDVSLFQTIVRRTDTPLQVHTFLDGGELLACLKRQIPYEDRTVYPFPRLLLCEFNLGRRYGEDGFSRGDGQVACVFSGCDVVSAVRGVAGCADLPVIMFTAAKGDGCVERSYSAGANLFVRKPSTPAGLADFIANLYHCASITPPDFGPLMRLPEFQPRPIGDA